MSCTYLKLAVRACRFWRATLSLGVKICSMLPAASRVIQSATFSQLAEVGLPWPLRQ